MKIEITPVTSWERVVNAARFTDHKEPLGKVPSAGWIFRMLRAQHSPIRLREYDIKFIDVPHYVMTHLVRHFIGVIPFVQTSRPDRDGNAVTRHEQRKDDLVSFQLSLNAQALMRISEERLCSKAEEMTRKVWRELVIEMEKVDFIMASAMVPKCIRLGCNCPELKSCGKCKSDNYKSWSETYWYEKEQNT